MAISQSRVENLRSTRRRSHSTSRQHRAASAIVQLAASPSRRSPPRRKLLRITAVASPSAIQPRTAIVAAFRRCLTQWSARQARAPMGTSMYSLSLRAAHRPASRLRMPEGRSRGARGLVGRAGDELPAAADSALRERGAYQPPDRGAARAAGRQVARQPCEAGPNLERLRPAGTRARSSVSRASQRGIAQLWDGVSEFSERRFDAPERGGQRGSGVPRARRGPKPLCRLEQRTGLVVELIRRITLGGAQRRSSARRAQLDLSSFRHATEPRKARYGRQWGLSCSRYVSAVARLGRMCGSTHRQGRPLQRSLADAVPQTTPDAHALATALPATRRRRVRLEHRG